MPISGRRTSRGNGRTEKRHSSCYEPMLNTLFIIGRLKPPFPKLAKVIECRHSAPQGSSLEDMRQIRGCKPLTPRQQEVFGLLKQGFQKAEILKKLHRSEDRYEKAL